MRRWDVFAAFLLSTCGVFGVNGVSQEARKPFTKQEQSQPQNQPTAKAPASDASPHLQSQHSPDGLATNAKEATRDAPQIDATKSPLLDQAQRHAAEFMNDLPNFVVTQTVTRSVRTPGKKDWRRQDKLEIELSYRVKTGEQFKLLRYNDKPAQMDYDQLKGATSTGEFGSILEALFSPQSQTEFKEVRRETFHGHQTVIYNFRVKKEFSSNTLTDVNSGRAVTTAYSGSIWIDTESARVLRIKQSAEDIQPGFLITLAERAVEYDWITFEGQRYLLPVYADVILGNDLKRYYLRNVIEMRNYRMFDTDLKILPGK
jgi:hypothetical protein